MWHSLPRTPRRGPLCGCGRDHARAEPEAGAKRQVPRPVTALGFGAAVVGRVGLAGLEGDEDVLLQG